jgi:hypothetical protein
VRALSQPVVMILEQHILIAVDVFILSETEAPVLSGVEV